MTRSARRRLAAGGAALLVISGAAACATNAPADSLTIEADYEHDEFAGSFYGFFPRKVTVRPGMTLKFHQTWTGAAHTVTMGEDVTKVARPFVGELKEFFDTGVLERERAASEAFSTNLPFFFDDNGVNQTAAQPCSVQAGGLVPRDGSACADRTLRPFTGRESYYSSGFIPFEGPRGNTFELPIAKDAKLGTYVYYCNLHGPAMSGEITITDGRPSKQSELNRRAKAEADRVARPLLDVYRAEKEGKSPFGSNLAGSGDGRTENPHGVVNEFTPRTIKAKVGEKVTWTFIGHNVSFNVPPYAPIYVVEGDGTVAYNEKLRQPAGGWPGRTPPLASAGRDPPRVRVDAGAFDGSGGLRSSGTGWAAGDQYSVTFTKRGTYPYACIVHPGMIGEVVVK